MSDFKYRLNELIRKTDKTLTIGDIEKVLLEDYGIKRSTFIVHRRIPKGSSSFITEETMAKYCAFFGVTPEKLRNYKVQTENKRKLSDLQPSLRIKDLTSSFNMDSPSR